MHVYKPVHDDDFNKRDNFNYQNFVCMVRIGYKLLKGIFTDMKIEEKDKVVFVFLGSKD